MGYRACEFSRGTKTMMWVSLLLGCGLGEPARGLPTRAITPLGDTVMVMVAARDLYPGVTIEEEDLVALELDPQLLPGGVYLSPEHVVGQVPRSRILVNEFIRAGRLANPESGFGLADLVPRGMRVAHVPATDAPPLPGSYVDLWWTPPGRPDCAVLQSVFVMGNDGMPRPVGTESVRTVQLLVTPPQHLGLSVARRSGTLRFALRNANDVNVVEEVQCSF
jgi:Flp pilus assembly protein CpaB